MRHSSQARVTDRAVFVPHDVLRPLFIDDGSFAYGLYHPPARDDDTGYHVVTPTAGNGDATHDFVFTAIPPRLWPIVAYLEIYVADRPRAMQQIAEALREYEVNILYGECAREGRTNAVWSAIVSFEALRKDALRVSIEERQLYAWRKENEHLEFVALIRELHTLYDRTANLLGALVGHPHPSHPLGKGLLRTRFDGKDDSPIYFRSDFKPREGTELEPHKPAVLPEFEGDEPRPYPPKAISGHVLYELQYFHERAARRLWHAPGSERHRPFRVECREPARLELGQTGRALFADSPLRGMVPSYGIAVMVPEQGFLRLSLIPPDNLGKFRRIEIRYTALLAASSVASEPSEATPSPVPGPPAPPVADPPSAPGVVGRPSGGGDSSLEQSSKGLLAEVTKALAADVQIWRVINHTHRLREPERGRLVLTVQYVGQGVTDEMLQERLAAVTLAGLRIGRPIFKALAPVRLFVSHRTAWPRWPEIRRLLVAVAEREGIRREDVVIVETGGSSEARSSGPVTVDQIRDSLRACDAMIQFGYRDGERADASGEWLGAEFLAAHCLDLPIAVLNRPGAESQDVLAGVTYFAVGEAAPQAEFAGRIRDALRDLVRQVRKSRMSTRESPTDP